VYSQKKKKKKEERKNTSVRGWGHSLMVQRLFVQDPGFDPQYHKKNEGRKGGGRKEGNIRQPHSHREPRV
jgi:hypothetical protein